MNLYSLQSIPNLTPAFVISCYVQVEQGNAGMGEDGRCTKSGSSPYLMLYMFLNFETILTDGKKNNIIILQHQKPCAFHNPPTSKVLCFSPINLRVQTGHHFLS